MGTDDSEVNCFNVLDEGQEICDYNPPVIEKCLAKILQNEDDVTACNNILLQTDADINDTCTAINSENGDHVNRCRGIATGTPTGTALIVTSLQDDEGVSICNYSPSVNLTREKRM